MELGMSRDAHGLTSLIGAGASVTAAAQDVKPPVSRSRPQREPQVRQPASCFRETTSVPGRARPPRRAGAYVSAAHDQRERSSVSADKVRARFLDRLLTSTGRGNNRRSGIAQTLKHAVHRKYTNRSVRVPSTTSRVSQFGHGVLDEELGSWAAWTVIACPPVPDTVLRAQL